MACGKPPDPDSSTTPSPFDHPSVGPATALLKEAEYIVGSQPPGTAVDSAIARAERMLAHARRDGVNEGVIQKLEGRFERLKGFAQTRMRDSVYESAKPRDIGDKSTSPEWAAKHFWAGSAKRNAPTVIKALESKDHWRSEEFKKTLLDLVEQNARIPDRYREQLPHDVARVLRQCPDAAGLVKAMTLRGQGRPIGSRSKLGSDSNTALGSAYELMGTAALIGRVSTPVNGGPKLCIEVLDKVTFGPKSKINREMTRLGVIDLPKRRSIECDIRIGRDDPLSGVREIGVDFKHSKAGVKYVSEDLRSQVEYVERVIRHGEIHEYHFVTNGRFEESFRKVVESANENLKACNCIPIACHEYVTTVSPTIL